MGTLKAVNLGLVSGTLNTELDGQGWDEYIAQGLYQTSLLSTGSLDCFGN